MPRGFARDPALDRCPNHMVPHPCVVGGDQCSAADDEAIDQDGRHFSLRPMRDDDGDPRPPSRLAPRGARWCLLFGRAPEPARACLECIAHNAAHGPTMSSADFPMRRALQKRVVLPCPSRRRWRCAYRRAGHRAAARSHGRIHAASSIIGLDRSPTTRGGCAMPVHA